ncbi:MAG: Hint domain-containing protein [Pseudomonadota bacterium]
MVDFLANGLAIAEILADNAGGQAIDTDGDGGSNKADEYVEIQNGFGTTVSLDGIEIWSQKDGLLYAFPDGETLAPGETATVVGEYTGTPPAGFYDAGGSANTNFLEDGEGSKWDTIFLLDTTTGPPSYVTLTYGTQAQPPSPPSGFPTNAVQIGPGEIIDSSAPNGASFTRNSDGEFVEATPDPGTPDFLCIAEGALVVTLHGRKPVERLAPGDQVRSQDGRYHAVVAIGRATHPQAVLAALPALTPIELPPGVLGATHPLRLSPNHCVLIDSPLAELLFDGPVLVAAKDLVAAGLARPAPQDGGADYIHLLFNDHIVLDASGVWVESLFLGQPGQSWVATQRAAGTLTETDASETDRIRHAQKAFRTLKSHEARLLAASLAGDASSRHQGADAHPASHAD